MQNRKLRMGWDVGGWHCDQNRKSRDALVLLEALDVVLQPLGRPWRGNLRVELATLTGVRLICKMLELCGLDELGPFDLTIAIDTPLGWPQAMLDLATGGGPTCVPEDDDLNPYTRRVTEIDLVTRGCGYRPLSAVRDMLGSQSTKGIHFLSVSISRCSQ
jgi:hypothetical protein